MCNQPARFDLHRPAIEVGTAEVMVFGAMFEDVIDRGEDRCGDGANGFLRPALGLEAEELSPVVAVFRALGGPGALHEHGFDRDRGESHDSSPPTPPYIRVRIRRFDRLSWLGTATVARPSDLSEAFDRAMASAGLLLSRQGPRGLPAACAA